MKRSYCVLFVLCSLLFTFLYGCGGGGPGAPGSSGSEDTGISVRVMNVTHSDPAGDQGDLWEVDFVQDTCDDGTAEAFGNDVANITFHGDRLNPNITSDNILYITNYKVTFKRENPSSPPINQVELGNMGGMFILPDEDTGPYTFIVLDSGMKRKIASDILSGQYAPLSYPLIYDMVIEIWGVDRLGKDFKVGPIIRPVSITNYNKC